jgi:cytochrome c553
LSKGQVLARPMLASRILKPTASAMALALSITASAVAGPAPDARRIADLGAVEHGVPACQSCHGPRGQGVAVQNGPRLAHLEADYIEGQLDAFATGARRHPVMSPIARALTPDQRAALAGYFAALPPASSQTADSPRPTEVARGRMLALTGDWSRNVPACVSCHGPGAQGVPGVTPPLVGQTQAYLLRQLTAYRDNDRKGALGLMNGIAKRLSPTQQRDVAAYLASLKLSAAAP